MQLLYKGKAKSIFADQNPENVIIHYNDDATAGNGAKHAEIDQKGVLNNQITGIIFDYLQKHDIKTHYQKTINEREQLCQKVQIIPLEVIVRNKAAGSISKRLGLTEGLAFDKPIYELCYKNDSLGDPLINEDHAIALKIANAEDLALIKNQTLKINQLLVKLFAQIDIELVDFKIEFGKNSAGQIILADEISPDTCRLWDKNNQQKLDKDRFRQDLGGLIDAYQIVANRLAGRSEN